MEGREGEGYAVVLCVPGFEQEGASTNPLRQRLLLSLAVLWPGEPVGCTKGVGGGGTLTCASYMEVALSTTEKTHLLNVFPLKPPPHHCKPGIDEENC